MLNNEHIFIENSPGIGDLIMLTPILRTLKSIYPGCKITVASWNPYSLQVIERIAYIDNTHAIKSSFRGRVQSFREFLNEDSVVFNSYQGALIRLAKLAGVRNRGGNCKDKYVDTGMFTHPFPYTNRLSIASYETDYLASKIKKSLDIEFDIDDYKCDVSQPNQEEDNRAMEILSSIGLVKDDDYIVLSPFGNGSIDLTLDTIKNLILYWTNRNYNIVIIGKIDEEFDRWYKSKMMLFRGKAYNICGMTSIMEMIAVIKNAKAVVSLDSGPMHIACALQKTTAGIFTSGSLTEWRPKQYCYPIKLPLECSNPCNDHDCERRICGDFSLDFINNKLNNFEKLLSIGTDE